MLPPRTRRAPAHAHPQHAPRRRSTAPPQAPAHRVRTRRCGSTAGPPAPPSSRTAGQPPCQGTPSAGSCRSCGRAFLHALKLLPKPSRVRDRIVLLLLPLSLHRLPDVVALLLGRELEQLGGQLVRLRPVHRGSVAA